MAKFEVGDTIRLDFNVFKNEPAVSNTRSWQNRLFNVDLIVMSIDEIDAMAKLGGNSFFDEYCDTAAWRFPLHWLVKIDDNTPHKCNCSIQVVMTQGCLCGGI